IPSSRIQYILHLVDVDVPLTKEEFALAKKDVPLAMEGLPLGDEDFFPLQDSYFPLIPSSSSSGTTEMPPNPRVLVPLGLGGAEACLDGSHGARISTPPCVKLTTRKTIILMGFSCNLKRVSIEALSLERDHSRLEGH
ncbi:Hypothetical protein FKW44_014698, partial [Caligus rogercresseyi]